jgi:predicted transcriptional regulator
MMDYDEAQVKKLTGSSTKLKVMRALKDGPKNIAYLVQLMGTRDSTILHSVKALIDERIVERAQLGYALTNKGHIQSLLLENLISGQAALNEYEGFWQAHDLSGIPAYLLEDIGKLSGGKCVGDDADELLKSQTLFIESISKAKNIWGVSPIIAPGYVEMILSLLDQKANITLILTDSIIKKIDSGAIQKCLSAKNFRLYNIPEIKVAFTVTDENLFLGLFYRNGTYDAHNDLVCSGKAAVDWGKFLFMYYLNKSQRVLSV